MSGKYWNEKSGSADKRERMVRDQIEKRGLESAGLLDAMRAVPRELFVPQSDRQNAYRDGPLPIGWGQTISQPYIVAYMTGLLDISGGDRVLEIGTGCGYQTAVLAELAGHVYSVEIIGELSERAEALLSSLGYENISCRVGDGSIGWEEESPFDAIMVTAAPARVPERLMDQLAEGGRMVIPVGSFTQRIQRITRREGSFHKEELIGVRFVPMTGSAGNDF